MEGGQEAPGGRSLAAQPSPTPTAVQKPQPNRGVGAAHTKALGCVPAWPSHRPRFTALQPEAPRTPCECSHSSEHPGRAAGTELQLPEHGLGNEHKLQPLARRKQKTQPCDAEQRCDQNQAPSPARARGAEPAGSPQPLPQTYLWRLRTPRQQLIVITPSARHGHTEPPRPR